MVIKRFKEQVKINPDKIAIKANEKSYTYKELNKSSDNIANEILGKVKNETEQDNRVVIALLLGHNADMIVGILGVLKSGNIYVPMDNNYPEKRLEYMLLDSETRYIITNDSNLSLAIKIKKEVERNIEIINIDRIDNNQEAVDTPIEIEENQIAYILYTSGSTSRPKGVIQTHRNIVHFIDCYKETLSITNDDNMTLFSSFSHDAAVMDIYGALLNGATLYPLDIKKHTNFTRLHNWLLENRITIWHSVPTFFRYFMNNIESAELLTSLRLIVLGGEAVLKRDIELYQKLFNETKLYNLYGQTESSFNCGQFISTNDKVDKIDKIVLGDAVSETNLFVVDEEGLEVEPFEEGEILVASPYISPGYLADKEATEKVFRKSNEFGSIYRTGDYGKLLLDGSIEFLGRKDSQIKIRGYRVELGDIESQLLRHEDIKEAVVILKEDDRGEKSLCGYLVINKDVTISRLRTYLASELPDYMIPSQYIVLDKMPTMPNGKTDRKVLTSMKGRALKLGSEYIAPETDLENVIATICKEELGLKDVGVNDNFFDVGAHSLNIVIINNKINDKLKIDMPVTHMFEFSTIKKLAEHIEKLKSGRVTNKSDREDQSDSAKRDRYKSGDIAVVGVSGRFPGAKNVEEYWENLIKGRETISFFNDEELEEMGIEKELLNNPNYIKAKGSLEDIEYFDALFFGYTPKDAKMMDPQMRFFHECAWEALEDAGYVSETYRGLIGLYAGASSNMQWQVLNVLSSDMGASESFSSRHFFDKDYISTRISYKLNLKGPSYGIQTACSTSLATVDMACKDLLMGACDMAMAGGVSIGLHKKSGYMYQKGMILSKDGHCKAFDANASGTVFGDGIGVVVLKRLEDAIADGDNIYAVVKGSATNNDGNRKVGYTAPSIEGQIEVVKAAQALAGVKPESISYVETHGTGTALGDPIEVEALNRSFETDERGFCAIGSVKTNIGHLNVAAGIAGFIKTVLALKNKKIPPSLHFEKPNTNIDFENSPFYVNTELKEWKNDKYPLRAGVSAFGIGGTNVHVVLEEAPKIEDSTKERQLEIITLSAKTKTALDNTTNNLLEYLKENKDVNLADVAYTYQVGRKDFKNRRMLVCSDVNNAIDLLTALSPSRVYTNVVNDKNEKYIVFMFMGQGSQYVNMGRDLYETQEVFREEMDKCFEILESILGYGVKDVIYPDGDLDYTDNKIDETYMTQPLVFSFQYSLAKQLMKWGINPSAMIGHSFGEYAAACIAGIMSLEDAVRMVAIRGELMHKIPNGRMMSVGLSEQEVSKFLNDRVSIAAINGETKCVISGESDSIKQLKKELDEKGCEAKILNISIASHCSMMDPILKPFEEEFRKVKLNKPKIPYISNLTGTWIKEEEITDPMYWVKHLRQSVRFNDGANELLKKENAIFIEVGPGMALSSFIRHNRNKKNSHGIMNTVRHPRELVSDSYYLFDKIGRLWAKGVHVDWSQLHYNENRKRLSLPTYPFEREYYWPKKYHIKDLMNNLSDRSSVSQVAATIGDPCKTIDKTEEKSLAFQDICEEEKVESGYQRPELSTEYKKPTDEIETILAQICSDIIGIDKIGIEDDFFELGADSLGAITFCGKIQSSLKVEVTVSDIFQNPTIKEVADIVKAVKEEEYSKIEAAPEREYYDASPAQKRLYTLQQFDKESIGYNLPGTLILEGVINVEKINETFVELIKRHEGLRTSFKIIDGEPVQYINKEVEFKLQYLEAGEQELREIIIDFIKAFDLSEESLLRVGLVKIAEEKHLLIFDMHHIISDGISMSILVKEFAQLYKGINLEPLKIQYKDYSEWLSKLNNSKKKEEQKSYWLNQFEGEVPILNLIGDYPRPSTKSFDGDRLSFKLEEGLTNKLRLICKETEATMYMLLLSAYNVLLHKYSGQEDIVVGSPIAGRHNGDFNGIIGMFVNTLAMRNFPKGEKSFKEFVDEVKKNALGAYANQDYQFEELVKNLNVKRDISRNPLFDVMFTMLSMDMSTLELEGVTIKPYDFKHNMSKLDMDFLVSDNQDGIGIEIEYSTKIFRKKTIERLYGHFKNILEQITENIETKLSEIQLITEDEKKLMLEDFNSTIIDYPMEKTIHGLFEEQVEKTPNNVAVTFGDKMLTYRELNKRANQLARMLVMKGVQSDTIVGIMVERSIEMIVGIMAIVKAGGAYLPIDPQYPMDRIKFMLEDSSAKILLTQSWLLEKITFDGEKISIDESSLYEGDESNLELDFSSKSLAYIIYTSGSTGKPKGVMIQHYSLINRLNWMQRKYPIGEDDVILQKTPFTFDVSVWEIFWWSITGARVHMLEKGGEKDPRLLVETIEKSKITTMHFVPSMLSIFLEFIENNRGKYNMYSLTRVFASGEALTKYQVEKFRKLIGLKFKSNLINLYGPTEATIDVSYFDCREFKGLNNIPIGKPIDNINIYITDEALNLQPIGVPGELCIGGDGLARGYLNRPELTAEKFVDNPYRFGEKIYRTGDLVRWLGDGNIEYLGRIDFQVKIRGYRIELGEIENRLQKHKAIKDSVVIDRKDQGGNKYLCAYIVSREEVTIQSLKEHLKIDLPDYMIPAYFVQIEELPLSSNGKINRKALPEPTHNLDTGTVYVAPYNEVQEKILTVWQEVLKNDKIGITDDFFSLGGDSFKALSVVSKLNGIISLADIFSYPTIELIWKNVFEDERSTYLLNKLTKTEMENDEAPALVCIPYGGGSSVIYKPLADELDNGLIKPSLYAINLPGHETGDKASLDTVPNTAKKCVEEIKNTISKPILLYGHCVGVALTIEIARLLEEEGYPVIGICIGAVLPVKNNLFGSAKIDVYEGKSDEEVHRFLKSLGGFDYPMEIEELSSLMTSFRHDVVQMRDYFYNYYSSLKSEKLKAPVYSIIGENDRLTRSYKRNYKRWNNYAETVKAPIVFKEAGHYYIKSHAKELADCISTIILDNNYRL